MCPGFQEPPNAGPVQRFLSLSSSLAFCACEERVFLSVLFSLLFSSSFSVVAFVVFVALSPPPTFPRRLCAVFFHFAFSYWGRRRHRGRRGHASDQSNLVTGKKERKRHSSPRLLSIFFPFFSAALRIYLSIYYLFHPSLLSVADFCSFSWQPQISGLLPAVVVKGI